MRGLKNRSRALSEPKDLRDDETRPNNRWREHRQQNAADRMTSWPETNEIRRHSREHHEPNEENPERTSLLNQKLCPMVKLCDERRRPELEVRGESETNSPSEKKKLSRIGRDDGPNKFGETFHSHLAAARIMPYSQNPT
jgi:hypothetical protein